MTLKSRIIPVLLTDGNGQCVKPVAFQRPYRKLGTMDQYIRVMESRNIDELFIIDINATMEKREPNYDLLRRWCDNLFCPVTYGGGISSLEHIKKTLENGADKVAIQHQISIIRPATEKFGSQAITAVIQYRFEDIKDIQEYAWSLEDAKAGEILLTCMDLDGTMKGYDLEGINLVAEALDIPVVALGGCGEPIHMHRALQAGASAVAAGSMFLYTDYTPRSCATELATWGNEVRL